MSVLSMGHPAGECNSPSESVAEAQPGDAVEALFSPDDTVSKFPVVSNQQISSKCLLCVIDC